MADKADNPNQDADGVVDFLTIPSPRNETPESLREIKGKITVSRVKSAAIESINRAEGRASWARSEVKKTLKAEITEASIALVVASIIISIVVSIAISGIMIAIFT